MSEESVGKQQSILFVGRLPGMKLKVVIMFVNRNGSVTVESELLFPALLCVLWPTFTVC
jgi:hypothetical protein